MKKLALLLAMLLFFNTSALDSCTAAIWIPPTIYLPLSSMLVCRCYYRICQIREGGSIESQRLVADQGTPQAAADLASTYILICACWCVLASILFVGFYLPFAIAYCNQDD